MEKNEMYSPKNASEMMKFNNAICYAMECIESFVMRYFEKFIEDKYSDIITRNIDGTLTIKESLRSITRSSEVHDEILKGISNYSNREKIDNYIKLRIINEIKKIENDKLIITYKSVYGDELIYQIDVK